MTLRIEEQPDEAEIFAQKVTFIDHRRSTSSIIDHRNIVGETCAVGRTRFLKTDGYGEQRTCRGFRTTQLRRRNCVLIEDTINKELNRRR
ncbi:MULTISPECIES: hypothetical protein [Burkholderia cepacia complex]|uniref:hypothetical protein n=1 Tax=Burkholderia cepacia complex TaxID=87882 RepID=UPI0012AEC4A4|nr:MULTISPECIES: hypothetical protein [Burkholderia cepacia complex]MDR5667636.1 hypothetical protein [Burkholderia cenocepacia]MDR5670649.1 hypothetical protein [Burkholderia cenocepacia]MDR8097183.1 hypothetical protein [Burkholderia cenocepacia]